MKSILPILIIFVISYLPLWTTAQPVSLNARLVANVNEFPQEEYNDIWGYVDSTGREYAILGTKDATVIYNLENPAEPERIARVPGSNSIWRDMKAFGNYVYVTTDQGTDGLVVINMSQAPDTVTWEFWRPQIDLNGNPTLLRTCHNIYIDEQGYGYLSGCNLNNGGVLIIDLFSEPGQPQFVSAAQPVYSHDNFSRGDTIWSADIFAGSFSAIDVSDKMNPVTLANQPTSSAFTHNCWLSGDGDYLFTTDERANAFMDAYDVSDLSNIRRVDQFQPADSPGTGTVPHNAHYHDGYLYTSWYTSGVRVIDAHRPENLVEVAFFDTWPGSDGGFNGCWGAYPFLPSGLLLASDISTGLYVFEIDLKRAAYLEGTVQDAQSGLALEGVSIDIFSDTETNTATSNLSGDFQTGLSEAGTYQVRFSREGYYSDTLTVTLLAAEVTERNVNLEPIPSTSFTGNIRVAGSNNTVIPGARIFLEGDQGVAAAIADGAGNFVIEDIFQGEYTFFSGAWGYRQKAGTINIGNETEIIVELEPGYEDDFILDLGWRVDGTATSGTWERGVPIGTDFNGLTANPGADVEGDLGDQCYVTGNMGETAGFDDVDNGTTVLTSPPADLTTLERPTLSFDYWFYNSGGQSPPDDALTVSIDNGRESVTLEVFTESASEWRSVAPIDLTRLIEITNDMRISFSTSDLQPNGHLVEAAIDRVRIYSAVPTSVADPAIRQELTIVGANRFSGSTTLRYEAQTDLQDLHFILYHQDGRQLQSWNRLGASGQITVGQNVSPGIYHLAAVAGNRLVHTVGLVKVN